MPRPKAEALFSGSRDWCGRASARASGIGVPGMTPSLEVQVLSEPGRRNRSEAQGSDREAWGRKKRLANTRADEQEADTRRDRPWRAGQ